MVFLKAHLSSPLVPSVSPSGVRVERLSSTAMNVSWTLLTLEEARGFVTSYTVSYRKDEGVAKRTTESVVVPGGEQSSVVIGGLDPGSSYLVSVSASTSAGSGEMSEPVVLAEDEYTTASTDATTEQEQVVSKALSCCFICTLIKVSSMHYSSFDIL